MSLFLLRFSIAGQRNETEAANNTASTFLEHTHIIDHTFRLHECACANIKVGVAAKLRRDKFNFDCVANERRFEGSNLFPTPGLYHHKQSSSCTSDQVYAYATDILSLGLIIWSTAIGYQRSRWCTNP